MNRPGPGPRTPGYTPVEVDIPATVVGGQAFNCTVRLNGTPTQNQVVNMTCDPSSSPLQNFPRNVTVLANTDRVTFSIQTNTVTSNTPVAIIASCNGGSKQNSITVTP